MTAHPAEVPLGQGAVSTTELNHRTAAVVERARRGERISVTWRGVVLAELAPARPHPFADLVARGLLRPAEDRTPFATFPHATRPTAGSR